MRSPAWAVAVVAIALTVSGAGVVAVPEAGASTGPTHEATPLDRARTRLDQRLEAGDVPAQLDAPIRDQLGSIDDVQRYRSILAGERAEVTTDATATELAWQIARDTDLDPKEVVEIGRLDELPAPVRDDLADVLTAYQAFAAEAESVYGGALPETVVSPAEVRDDVEPAGTSIPDLPSRGPTAAEQARVAQAQARLLAAATDLAETVDGAPPGVTVEVEICPAVAIFVGGENNTYRENCQLIVDDGGDDTYLNNAGGSRLRPQDDDDCASVSLFQLAEPAAALVDLGGEDTYGNASAPRLCGSNGGGWFGAGFLFDGGGSDRYIAAGGGANGGGYYGQGFLADVAGDDDYDGGANGLSQGGGFIGRGTLVDAAGDDTYNGTGLGVNGGGIAGVGLLADLGGSDRYVSGEIANGGGLAGTGTLVDLAGDDVYNATSQAVNGGGFVGAGALVDATGNDTYLALGNGANGGASLGSGLLHDLAGDDVYRATVGGVNGGASLGAAALVDAQGEDRYEDDVGGSGTDKTVVPKGEVGAQVDLPHTPSPPAPSPPPEGSDPAEPRPHVTVAVSDTGINPYHDVYSRPDLTEHPCTYIPDFPCDVKKLNLSLDAPSLKQAIRQDAEKIRNLTPGQWYWIPQTSIVAAHCEIGDSPPCILSCSVDEALEEDDLACGSGEHGTWTTSSVLSENPEALIAFNEGGADTDAFRRVDLPVDLYSSSYGQLVPTPAPAGTCDTVYDFSDAAPLFVKSAGNTPKSTYNSCWTGHPQVLSVGGAYADPEQEESSATKNPDVVSYYCRPTADDDSLDGSDTVCGTSFAAPTVAGGISRAILRVRQDSGYTGSLQGNVLDPVAGLTVAELRDAVNRTASYDPAAKYDNRADNNDPPLNDDAPWLQWGWGFYDGWVANATIDHLLGTDTAQPKPDAARTYMHTQHRAQSLLYSEPV